MCVVVLILVVFFGGRLKLKGSKYRATGVWLITLSFAALYAFAPGWYKHSGGGWSVTGVSTNKTGLEYVKTIAFDPDFRMSPLIFTALATVLGIGALVCTKLPPPIKGQKEKGQKDECQNRASRLRMTPIQNQNRKPINGYFAFASWQVYFSAW